MREHPVVLLTLEMESGMLKSLPPCSLKPHGAGPSNTTLYDSMSLIARKEEKKKRTLTDPFRIAVQREGAWRTSETLEPHGRCKLLLQRCSACAIQRPRMALQFLPSVTFPGLSCREVFKVFLPFLLKQTSQ